MRVGIVGCGNIAAYHLPYVISSRHVQAVAITDTNRHAAEAMARRFRIRTVYPDMGSLMVKHRPNLMHILTPPATHAELAIKAMEAGCHVLVEKPMALTIEDADAMAECAARKGVKLCVNHNYLWQPLMRKMVRLVERGSVGKIVHVDTHYGFDVRRSRLDAQGGDQTRTAWMMALNGGPLFDSIPHPASILLHFLKEPTRVWAVVRDNGILPGGSPDELRVLVDGANATGAMAVSLGSRPDCFTVTIYGTEMTVQANLSNMTMVTRRHRRVPKALYRTLDSVEQALQLLSGTALGSLGIMLGIVQPPGQVGPIINGFYQSVLTGSPPPVSTAEGSAVVRLTNRIWEQVAL